MGAEVGGATSEAAVLELLHDLVRLEGKFHSLCGLHRKPCNMYCFECRDDPICLSCKSERKHSQHADKIIQVYNATHKKAVLERDIAALIDTSQIQKLINNGDTVLYIRSRRPLRDPQERVARRTTRACHTCVFSFPPSVMDQGIKFCSINCKVEYSPSFTPNKSPVSSGSDTAVEQAPEESEEAKSFRKRPRKQMHPERSPMM